MRSLRLRFRRSKGSADGVSPNPSSSSATTTSSSGSQRRVSFKLACAVSKKLQQRQLWRRSLSSAAAKASACSGNSTSSSNRHSVSASSTSRRIRAACSNSNSRGFSAAAAAARRLQRCGKASRSASTATGGAATDNNGCPASSSSSSISSAAAAAAARHRRCREIQAGTSSCADSATGRSVGERRVREVTREGFRLKRARGSSRPLRVEKETVTKAHDKRGATLRQQLLLEREKGRAHAVASGRGGGSAAAGRRVCGGAAAGSGNCSKCTSSRRREAHLLQQQTDCSPVAKQRRLNSAAVLRRHHPAARGNDNSSASALGRTAARPESVKELSCRSSSYASDASGRSGGGGGGGHLRSSSSLQLHSAAAATGAGRGGQVIRGDHCCSCRNIGEFSRGAVVGEKTERPRRRGVSEEADAAFAAGGASGGGATTATAGGDAASETQVVEKGVKTRAQWRQHCSSGTSSSVSAWAAAAVAATNGSSSSTTPRISGWKRRTAAARGKVSVQQRRGGNNSSSRQQQRRLLLLRCTSSRNSSKGQRRRRAATADAVGESSSGEESSTTVEVDGEEDVEEERTADCEQAEENEEEEEGNEEEEGEGGEEVEEEEGDEMDEEEADEEEEEENDEGDEDSGDDEKTVGGCGVGSGNEESTEDCGSRYESTSEDEQNEEEDENDEDEEEDDESGDEDTAGADSAKIVKKQDIANNVVKVYCTHCWPSFSYPWTTRGQTQSTSTGTVFSIKERLLLSNAHSVESAAVVQVRKRGDHEKYEAKVLCLGHDCDLSLLTVEDDSFWEDLTAVTWGESPKLEDPVTMMGYPVGGDNTSVTQGVVSRIDFQRYSQGGCSLLAIQIDAAINGGNSGGPALNKHKQCVGIAFQSLKDGDTENIGYIIPREVVFHFMEDWRKNRKYTGFGSCNLIWQALENKNMQQCLGVKDRGCGVLVSKVDKTSCADAYLKKGDILLSLDGQTIATDGTVPFENGERITFEWLLSKKFAGESCRMTILRNRREKEIELPVCRSEPLVPAYLPDKQKPQYFIAGGVVFVPLSELFMTAEYGQDCWCHAPVALFTAWHRTHKNFSDEQVVVVGHVLAHEITVGYEEFSHHCVLEFNGEKVRNLRHLCNLVENSQDEYWRFDLDSDLVMILQADSARAALDDILKQNMIPSRKSDFW